MASDELEIAGRQVDLDPALLIDLTLGAARRTSGVRLATNTPFLRGGVSLARWWGNPCSASIAVTRSAVVARLSLRTQRIPLERSAASTSAGIRLPPPWSRFQSRMRNRSYRAAGDDSLPPVTDKTRDRRRTI